jgi:hypothetical protein
LAYGQVTVGLGVFWQGRFWVPISSETLLVGITEETRFYCPDIKRNSQHVRNRNLP